MTSEGVSWMDGCMQVSAGKLFARRSSKMGSKNFECLGAQLRYARVKQTSNTVEPACKGHNNSFFV